MVDPILLKTLLKQKHWQTYRTFCSQYDRAAHAIDATLVGSYPSRAQLHRWQSGDLKGLPYPHHCQILEAMFPGFTAAQLFERMNPTLISTTTRSTSDSELLRAIERGLNAPATATAEPGWRSEMLGSPRTPVQTRASFPLALRQPAANQYDPAEHIAKSVLMLGQRLRLPDAEVSELAKLAGHVVELDMMCSIAIDADGWSTITYCHQLLNLTTRPIKRLTRELWFETTNGSLVIEPIPDSERRISVQRTHDTKNLLKFACKISPGIEPGDVGTVSYSCQGGQFVHNHYWRQALPRYTRHLTVSIRHGGVSMLLNCTAIEEQADGSEVSAIEDLGCADDAGDAIITLTRDYLQPSQAVTLRWEVSRAAA